MNKLSEYLLVKLVALIVLALVALDSSSDSGLVLVKIFVVLTAFDLGVYLLIHHFPCFKKDKEEQRGE